MCTDSGYSLVRSRRLFFCRWFLSSVWSFYGEIRDNPPNSSQPVHGRHNEIHGNWRQGKGVLAGSGSVFSVLEVPACDNSTCSVNLLVVKWDKLK